ncbi:hypothetical protein [Chelativorans xinjiangense]|uniref:hypothetical protein n=1 Tax=Chelativorans xinjiangense TaxID=2681485 RepID=UPI001915449F|nr:hypothetical protein [Chelativorans xinjiangense]
MSTTQQNAPLEIASSMASESRVSRYAAAFAVSAGITSVLSALLVVLKESNEDTVLAWMKAATGHHWVTHGLIDLILFIVIGLLVARTSPGLENRPGVVVGWLVGGVAVGAVIIAAFFGL